MFSGKSRENGGELISLNLLNIRHFVRSIFQWNLDKSIFSLNTPVKHLVGLVIIPQLISSSTKPFR